MNNLNKSRFIISALLLISITVLVFNNLEASSKFFSSTQLAISEYLGWFIILTANGFLLFSFSLIFTRYKDIRLGGYNAQPAYTYSNWIAMLFSAGLGIGLLFYGVAEPIGNLNDYPEMLENNISHNAGKALSLTNLHWGLHGWAVYASLGLCFAFASYNKNKAFRVSSLLGESVESNKPLAAVIDIIAILTTVIGIATSLGLGASQINSGLDFVFNIKLNEFIIITIITLLGLISVCLGLDAGIKRLSQINMIIAVLLVLTVLLLGPTVFILNAMVQNAGAYLNQIIQLSTWTEAYNDSVYQNGYTLFYFTWWFAWAPFVSLFIARISYGRTIKEFVIGVLLVPSLIVFIWMGIFGNSAIYQVLNNIGDISGAVSENASTALFVLYDSMSFSTALSISSLILIVTFFVTSSDSGALVASMLSSKKGAEIDGDSPLLSRITWAILLGVVAAVLLAAGGLGALQTAVVIFGVPFSIITIFACRELFKSLERELDN
ncbi:BCCT family transporter [Gammaproteobacteria bacterium]|nr:BCCT family transporter [Gammaproteobacteria bacterium]MDC1073633.1 BCCT family transporter [Gammaproteobacteria bacterium]